MAIEPDTGVIMLTMLEDNDSLFAAMCAGARGYILRGGRQGRGAQDHSGRSGWRSTVWSGDCRPIDLVFPEFQRFNKKNEATSPFPDLTDREREVLDLIAAGENDQEIAGHLHVSTKTISNHISNIFGKLQVADRAQAIVKARQVGLGE